MCCESLISNREALFWRATQTGEQGEHGLCSFILRSRVKWGVVCCLWSDLDGRGLTNGASSAGREATLEPSTARARKWTAIQGIPPCRDIEYAVDSPINDKSATCCRDLGPGLRSTRGNSAHSLIATQHRRQVTAPSYSIIQIFFAHR